MNKPSITLEKLIYFLDNLLPSQRIVDFCPNGLQVEGKKDIRKVATAVSADLKTIEAAIQAEVDALIVHHGIFWQKDSYVIQGIKRKKLALLLDQEMSLIAYHLPLDMHPQLGNNWCAAQAMGWENLQPFCYVNGVPIGVKGEIKPCSRDQFKAQLEHYYEHQAVCAMGGPESIKTAALVSGGAYKSILDAAREGVDAFITGSFDEPVWHQAFEEKINFFALGHSATERVGPRALALYLKQELGIPCFFIDTPNPF